MKRIAYEDSSTRYIFLDTQSGQRYRGEPGEEYGLMSPISQTPHEAVESERPGAFASEDSESESDSEDGHPPVGQDGRQGDGKDNGSINVHSMRAKPTRANTFYDILSPDLIRAVTDPEASSTIKDGLISKPSRWKTLQKKMTGPDRKNYRGLEG